LPNSASSSGPFEIGGSHEAEIQTVFLGCSNDDGAAEGAVPITQDYVRLKIVVYCQIELAISIRVNRKPRLHVWLRKSVENAISVL